MVSVLMVRVNARVRSKILPDNLFSEEQDSLNSSNPGNNIGNRTVAPSATQFLYA